MELETSPTTTPEPLSHPGDHPSSFVLCLGDGNSIPVDDLSYSVQISEDTTSSSFLATTFTAPRSCLAGVKWSRRRLPSPWPTIYAWPATYHFISDGSLIAVGLDKLLQIWQSSGFRKEFFPLKLMNSSIQKTLA